jgi:ferritin-like metal-binding protein YciE
MELASLHELYVEGLRHLYRAEHQIPQALPKRHKGAELLQQTLDGEEKAR